MSLCLPLHHSHRDGQQEQILIIPPRTSTHSLISSCWSLEIGSFQGNNSLKGNLLLQFCFSLRSLCLSLHLSLPAGLIWSPGKCPTVMSWCDLCHGLWSRLISLLSPILPPPPPQPALRGSAPHVSASLAPPARRDVGAGEHEAADVWGENSSPSVHLFGERNEEGSSVQLLRPPLFDVLLKWPALALLSL